MAVSTDDQLAIADHMARYCWAVDEGDAEGWAALWTEDGVFAGATPEPVRGREALKGVVTMSWALGQGGRVRHLAGNLVCDYDGGPDRVKARYYNLVTNWLDGGKFTCIALSHVVLVRNGAGWLLADSQSIMYVG